MYLHVMKRFILLFLFAPLLFCFNKAEKDVVIQQKLIGWGYKEGDSSRKIDAVIIHSSYYPNSKDSFNLDSIIGLYKQYGVSAHYIINRQGIIYQLVEEKNISWHAGKGSLPDGRTNINSVSIGIEIINTKFAPPNEKQYGSLASLLKDIKKRHTITYIKGHSDIAPGRKTDPWHFDWGKIKEN